MQPLALLPFNMLYGLRKAGFEMAELAAWAGLEPQDLRKPLTEQQADRFFVTAYERVGNPAAGLKLGLQPMRAELFGVVGFSAMTCASFGEALSRIAHYNALVSACQIDIHTGCDAQATETEVRIAYSGPLRPYSRCRLDIQMGTLLSFGRTFTEQPIVPVRLTLAERPSYHAQYEEAFGCPTVFDHSHDAIVFRRADIELPLISANAQVASLFEDAAERSLQARGGTVQAVREVLRNQLHGDIPTIDSVARSLFVSERTLQRRLAAEDMRFTTLLDDARKEQAQRYLSSGRASLTEIAYLLGFADPNSFFRAFKRWTGKTPADFRAGGQAAAGLFIPGIPANETYGQVFETPRTVSG